MESILRKRGGEFFKEGLKIKILLVISVLSLGYFLINFFSNVGMGHVVLYYLLTIGLCLKVLKVCFEWYHFGGLKKKNGKSKTVRTYTVDMFTTACPGEPFDMIRDTLKAMVEVRYPHKTYLCDEGNDPKLKALCLRLGVVHVTRDTHENAKAGNINNALKQAKGEICVILDPDHAPTPDFLDEVLHPFEDPQIGYVQVVQAYGNQKESLIARAAAEQTYLFYGPYMNAMSDFGTAQAIGANCTFRRSALDSIGGHAPGLTEDMHTSMLLHAKGWKSVYIPKILSRGLVPSSLSAYYSQQLKWSRGSFDLWINLFPKLFNKFSWRQKIHYGLMPIYYLFGLVTLIDIVVPAYSLITGNYPWLMNPIAFFTYYTPFLVCSLLFRFKAQDWLNEPQERGLHLLGGIVRVGTWWIYIIGFLYTLLNIKVPYIPTPKEHTSKNELLLGLPNLVVALFCLGTAWYGLSYDWQPYSLLMASFSLINFAIFSLAFFVGQYTLISRIKDLFRTLENTIVERIYYGFIGRLQKNTLTISLLGLLITSILIYSNFKIEKGIQIFRSDEHQAATNVGGDYIGIYSPEFDEDFDVSILNETEESLQSQWSIISTYLAWGNEQFPTEKWKFIVEKGAIPMITWEPFTNKFGQYSDHPLISTNKKVFKNITEGYFDAYVDSMALALRELKSPVFLRFAHEMENPMYPWSKTGNNTAEEFKEAWKYVHYRFDSLGAHNVSWVWSPWSVDGIDDYFPYGENGSVTQYVDWVSLTALNYGKASPDSTNVEFTDIYLPFKEKLNEKDIELPVMLAEFGSTSYGNTARDWNQESLNLIKTKFPEIKSIVFFYSDIDKNWITPWRPTPQEAFIDWKFDMEELAAVIKTLQRSLVNNLPPKTNAEKAQRKKSKSIEGEPGDFVWKVDGEDFYMRGICYNAGHDWHDGFFPLSRKQVREDFAKIKEMGANTIRRYQPSIYDSNILKTAEEFDLKVMYGFWFDPKTDFLKDKSTVQAYKKKVLKNVKKHLDNPSIIAWNIGNETYGLLKKHYAKPYLTLNRRAYLEFLEELAQAIQEIDPERPVFSSEEHDHYRLISTILDFKNFAPSIDVIGINSYYEENISTLNQMFTSLDSLRPYAVTEFGPKGYWNREFGDFWNDSLLIELSSLRKAEWYEKQWDEYIANSKGDNLGGLAFSWRDRYEGTATWFGISDYEGRIKPAYSYLKRAWTGAPIEEDQFADLTIVSHWNAARPGESFWLSAATTNNNQDTLTYHWEVYDQNKWEEKSILTESLLDNQYVKIQVPKGGGDYRIYVYATDSKDNVVTASRPLIIGQNE
ncbi:glycosyltransferase [Pleomorphovibrio marinus]|uniref:glycosyltransferase n=1 Tax=Pleomorphovibrio marinus TaxID=2164132 RepID=UPI000E0C5638|nr:glycosyltransferase [Pleomorphovibrio marinus]